MRGFTLIESIVVIAILAIVALASINTITEFQRNAILSAATQELGSTLRVARQDSISGLVKPGETDGSYGITLSGNSYQLNRYTPSLDPEVLEQHTIDSSLIVSPNPIDIRFTRITGAPSSEVTMTITRTGTTTSRTVVVNANGLISL